MSLIEQIEVTCGCGVKATVERWQSLTADLEPARLEAVLQNRFNRLDCAACGRVTPLPVPFLLAHAGWKVFLQLVADDADPKVARDAMAELLPPGAWGRLLLERDSLVEKARLAAAGMDDGVVELMKLMLRSSARLEGKLLFERADVMQLHFTTFTQEGTQTLSVPAAVYGNVLSRFGATPPGELTVDLGWATRRMQEAQRR